MNLFGVLLIESKTLLILLSRNYIYANFAERYTSRCYIDLSFKLQTGLNGLIFRRLFLLSILFPVTS
jgi:hypothetical protein